jgi:hypothetical protein
MAPYVTEPAVEERCPCGHIGFLHRRQDKTDTHCANYACNCPAYGTPYVEDMPLPEPPLTPEEEEAAPEDVPFVQTCVRPGCIYDVETDCRYGCRAAADELSREANEMDERWAKAMGDDEPPPPQPERRPPYAVAYSVHGHLYEVAVPGDAAVQAVDGALVIRHHLGPVIGIVQVLPVINEGGAHGAEADN